MAKVRGEAWITAVLNDESVDMAAVLVGSLRHCGTTRTLIALIGPRVSLQNRKKLYSLFDGTLPLENFFFGAELPEEWKAKFVAVSLPTINKAVYISPNHLILENIDYIFENWSGGNLRLSGEELVDQLSSSMFLFSPSTKTQATLNSAFQNDLPLPRILKTVKMTLEMGAVPENLKQQCSLMNGISTSELLSTAVIEFMDVPPNENGLKKQLFNFQANGGSTFEKIVVKEWSRLHNKMNVSPATGPKETEQLDFKEEPIAIVGMACRYAGANNLNEFWKVLEGGLDTLSPPSDNRWTEKQWIFKPKANTRETQAGFLSVPVDEFDAKFFGVNNKEAERMDPQTRLLHEVLWEALENSGIDPTKLQGTHTGIFTGSWLNDYHYVVEKVETEDFLKNYMGNSLGAAAARLSFLLGVTGPCIATESGCSSAMVSLDRAVKSLRAGECKLAVAGGVNLILKPSTSDLMPFVLSSTGKCHTWDAKADGFVRAEGCGLLILKRLTNALQDRDNIWAVIRGSAVCQEGISHSLGTPTVECEALAMTLALEDAHVDPSQVDFVEAHGTGTRVGDPMEVAAITKAYFSPNRTSPLLVGSVKTNVGHTESCSGITGIMKVVLAMHHEKIPRNLNFEKLNPEINLDKLPIVIPTENLPWPKRRDGSSRFAGVSSFGITGTDGHVVIQEPPGYNLPKLTFGMERPLHLLKITGKTERALEELHSRYLKMFQGNDEELPFPDITFTGNTGRPDFQFREVVIAENLDEAARKLESGQYLRAECDPAVRRKICFLFPGQGSQYPGMAQQLYNTSPVFRINFDHCEKILKERHDISVLEFILESTAVDVGQLSRTLFSQTSIFCVEYCLFKLWESWGVTPDYVLGHSLGEFVAGVAAGILTLADALKLVVEKSRLIDSLPSGQMLVIQTERKWVDNILKNNLFSVDIAAVNSNQQTVVAGDFEGISQLQEFCRQAEVKATVLAATHPFHSRFMDPILEELHQVAKSVSHRASEDPHRPQFISSLEGAIIPPSRVDPNYWVCQTRNPVQFLTACQTLKEMGITDYLEIGPQPILSGFVKLEIPMGTCLPSLRRGTDDWSTILLSLGKLYLLGYDVNWEGVDSLYLRKKVPILPNYPFERKSFWMSGQRSKESSNHQTNLHPLVGFQLNNASSLQIFQTDLWLDTVPFLRDHAFRHRIIYPGAAFLEMAFVATHLANNDNSTTTLKKMSPAHLLNLENFSVHAPLELREGEDTQLQVVVERAGGRDRLRDISIFSRTADLENNREWLLHVTSSIGEPQTKMGEYPKLSSERIREIRKTYKKTCSQGFYAKLVRAGANFGDRFQSIKRFHFAGEEEVVSEIAVLENTGKYFIHPVLLDGFIQTGVALKMMSQSFPNDNLQLPVKVSRVTWIPSKGLPTGESVLAHVWNDNRGFSGYLLTKDLRPLVYLEGVTLAETSVSNLEAVLVEQGKRTADFWEEVWRPLENHGSGTCAVEKRTVALSRLSKSTTLQEDAKSWVIFVPKQVAKFRHLLDSLSSLAQVTAVFQSAEDREIYQKGSTNGITCIAPSSKGDVHIEDLLKKVTHIDGIVFAWGIGNSHVEALDLAFPFLGVAHYICQQERPSHLYVVTNGVFPVSKEDSVSNPEAAVLYGMARALKSERQNAFVRCIDFDDDAWSSCMENLLRDIAVNMESSESEEPQHFLMANRGGAPFKPELVKSPRFSNNNRLKLPPGAADYQLVLPNTKKISDLQFTPLHLDGVVGDEEIQIRVQAYALNFKDVLAVTKPTVECDSFNALGIDLAGVVTKVGNGLAAEEKFKEGDRVYAWNPLEAPLSSSIVLPGKFVQRIPPNVTVEEAATLPVAFCTAYHSLVNLAQITEDDTVLLHTASGGVGLVALQLCQHVGAQIIATAGSEVKRAYLRSLGVQHVFDSRSLTFAQGVMKATGGHGVNIVLNSLTSPGFKEATLSVCAKEARFVEMSRISIWTPEKVQGLRPDVQYEVIYLPDVGDTTCSSLLTTFGEYVKKGVVKPLRYVKYNAVNIREALAYFQQARHIGKIVCSMPDPMSEGSRLFNGESTYLITGGLGGIGFEVCKWMLERGATDVVLMGRRPPQPQISTDIDALREKGFKVEIFMGDVGDGEVCQKLFERIAQLGKPLRGIMHGAGVLKDNLYVDQKEDSFRATFNPKVEGTWNLHHLSKALQLEHFVLFSSMSALLGIHGQATHAAANCFLDSFAHYRRSLGLPATSINWGQWDQVGVAKDKVLLGLHSVSVKRMLNSLEVLLGVPTTQVAIGDFTNISDVCTLSGTAKGYIDEAALAGKKIKRSKPTAERILSTEKFWESFHRRGEERLQIALLMEMLTSSVRDTLGLGPQEAICPTASIAQLGGDSLVVLELRNKVQLLLGQEYRHCADVIKPDRSIENICKDIHSKILGNSTTQTSEETTGTFKSLLEKDCVFPDSLSTILSKAPCRPSEISTVLVTGTTGFLGGHILSALCTSRYDSLKSIICLVRVSNNIKDPLELLVNSPQWDSDKGHYSRKLRCLEADFTLPNFGLSEEAYSQLCTSVDAVIHCAAKTNHTEPYLNRENVKDDIRTVNVGGTMNILKFAAESRVKHVYFGSTFWSAAVLGGGVARLSGRWPGPEVISWTVESNMPGYYTSKYVCEVLLGQAVSRGIPCKAFRFPVITGNSHTWKVNYQQNHFIERFTAVLQVKAVANLPVPLNTLPVDICAETSLHLFFSEDAPSEIYFVVHPRPQLDEAFREVAQKEFGVTLDIVDHFEFAQRIRHAPTPLDLWSELYTNSDRLTKIFSNTALMEYSLSLKQYITARVKQFVPHFGDNLEPPIEYIRRDMKYAQSKGYLPAALS